jgi:predicted metal-dependent HD superfamily phosphohydrolase
MGRDCLDASLPERTRRAIAAARTQLAPQLSPQLSYHNAAHTFADILPTALRLGRMQGFAIDQLDLLAIAAGYHDLGWIRAEENHEQHGIELAREALPRFGYSPAELDLVAALIEATRMPQQPGHPLARTLADADLGNLGRPDFWRLNAALRRERQALGQPEDDERWWQATYALLRARPYFTAVARGLWGDRRRAHARAVGQRLRRLQGSTANSVCSP